MIADRVTPHCFGGSSAAVPGLVPSQQPLTRRNVTPLARRRQPGGSVLSHFPLKYNTSRRTACVFSP